MTDRADTDEGAHISSVESQEDALHDIPFSSNITPLISEVASVSALLDGYHSAPNGVHYFRGKQAWNHPPANRIKVTIALFCFAIMGLTDSAIGALLPSIEEHYQLNDFQVSTLFLVPVVGSLVSAGISGWAHIKVGRRGVGVLGLAFQSACYAITMMAPSYHIMLLGFILAGLGSGLINGSWNAWIGAFDHAHSVLGVLHGAYALGGMLGPSVVALLLTLNMQWYSYYRMMTVLAMGVLVAVAIAFRHDTSQSYYYETQISHDDDLDEELDEDIDGEVREAESVHDVTPVDHTEIFRTQAVWTLAAFLCAYNGIELGYSGWLVTYMIRERNADPKTIGLISTCFWTGLTTGRLCLGFVTGRFKSLSRVVLTYMFVAIGFHCLFWAEGKVPLGLSMLNVALIGIFIGPVYPSAMVMATSVLPKRLHVVGISTAAALSGCGSAIFPVVVGWFVNYFGASALLILIFCFYWLSLGLWGMLALEKKRFSESVRERSKPSSIPPVLPAYSP